MKRAFENGVKLFYNYEYFWIFTVDNNCNYSLVKNGVLNFPAFKATLLFLSPNQSLTPNSELPIAFTVGYC